MSTCSCDLVACLFVCLVVGVFVWRVSLFVDYFMCSCVCVRLIVFVLVRVFLPVVICVCGCPLVRVCVCACMCVSDWLLG